MTLSAAQQHAPDPAEHDLPVAAERAAPQPLPAAEGGSAPVGVLLPRIKIDVFTESVALRASLERAAADRRAARTEFAFLEGSFGAAAAHYRDTLSPDLVVVEQSGWIEDLDWLIEALAEVCQPTTRLMVIGDRNDVVLYRHLMRAGVSDYLFHPVEPLVFLEAIASIFSVDPDETELGTVIAFIGTRGGAGASTLAQNVASVISRDLTASTLLIDADLGFGTAALQFDVTPVTGLGEALSERDDLDADVLERLVHWRSKRLGLLAAPERGGNLEPPEPDAMRQVVDQARRVADFVVLDLPHGWSPWTVEALSAADRVVLVGTADLPSLRNARTMMGLLSELRPNDEPPAIVLNRLPARDKPSVSPEEFRRILDRDIAARIPFDGAAAASEMSGTILSEAAPKSGAVAAITTLAARLSERERRAPAKPGHRSLLARLFGGRAE